MATSASITAWISTRSPSRRKSRSASGASLRNSSNTFILSLAIAVTSFIVVVDEGDAVALVLPDPAVSYPTSWDTTHNCIASPSATCQTSARRARSREGC